MSSSFLLLLVMLSNVSSVFLQFPYRYLKKRYSLANIGYRLVLRGILWGTFAIVMFFVFFAAFPDRVGGEAGMWPDLGFFMAIYAFLAASGFLGTYTISTMKGQLSC